MLNIILNCSKAMQNNLYKYSSEYKFSPVILFTEILNYVDSRKHFHEEHCKSY